MPQGKLDWIRSTAAAAATSTRPARPTSTHTPPPQFLLSSLCLLGLVSGECQMMLKSTPNDFLSSRNDFQSLLLSADLPVGLFADANSSRHGAAERRKGRL